jgi:hypothetical protein
MSERAKLAAPGKNRSTRLRLSAKSLKCTVVLDASQLAGFEVPNGQPRVAFTIDVGGRAVTGEFNSKSLRRVVTAIAECKGRSKFRPLRRHRMQTSEHR